MQFTKSLMLLAALTTGSLALPQGHEKRQVSSTPAASSSSSGGGAYSTDGFGASTANSGEDITYKGNTGEPWGSNIIEISSSDADRYQYVAEISGDLTESWSLVFWNKYGPSGQMDGFFGHHALDLTVNPGETKYVAFQSDTNGGFAAAPGSVPTNGQGEFASTWGEFDFGSNGNSGWSGFDVSAIVPQNAGMEVQGMKICDQSSGTCSSLTPDAAVVDNAYTTAETDIGGIGGNISGSGPVRLIVTLNYQG